MKPGAFIAVCRAECNWKVIRQSLETTLKQIEKHLKRNPGHEALLVDYEGTQKLVTLRQIPTTDRLF